MPYLEGFPPGNEMPALAWITKSVSSLVRILLGAVRYAMLRYAMLCYAML